MEQRTTGTSSGTSLARTRRGALGSFAAGLTGLALAACGGTQSQPAQTRSKTPINLTFLSWRPVAMDQFEPAWEAYSKQHAVKLEVDRGGDYAQTKLTTMFASDTGPDLFDANTQTLPKMYESGFVLPVDKYLARDRIALDKDWALTGIERWRQKTFGVPYWAEPFGVYYNKDLFRQRGIEDPWEKGKGDWTLEQMVDAARRINEPANDVWGLDWSLADAYGIGPFIWTRGVSHMQYDPVVEFKLQMPEALQANTMAIEWDMRQKLNVAAPTPEAAEARTRLQGGKPGIATSGGSNRFATGRIGIHWRSVNDWRRMWPIIGNAFQWDLLPVPSIGGRPGSSWSAGHPVCAYAKTQHPDDAWAFMRFMMEDEFQGFLAENQFLVPAKKSHQNRFFRPPEQYKYQHPQVFADVYTRPYGILWANYNAQQNIADYAEGAQAIFRGEAPLQSGFAELERRLNQDIELGGGENPFKGIRWPIQPR